MTTTRDRYINLFTDFGFKKLFGEEINKFQKQLHELETDFDRWLFAFKNLHRLKNIPKELEEGIFGRLLELAEIARMDERERDVYEESLKDYWDIKSAMETYYKEGIEQGIEQGIKRQQYETARKALEKGLPPTLVAELSGLSIAEVEALANDTG